MCIRDSFDIVCKLAEKRGIRVTGSELVGLIPLNAMLMAGKHYLKKHRSTVGVPESRIVEVAVQTLCLSDVSSFDPKDISAHTSSVAGLITLMPLLLFGETHLPLI